MEEYSTWLDVQWVGRIDKNIYPSTTAIKRKMKNFFFQDGNYFEIGVRIIFKYTKNYVD